MVLEGRLGLERARIPHADRHGVIWLGRGRLYVENGTLRFATKGYDGLPAGSYAIPFQMLSCIILEPGASVTHDALRLLARHQTGLVAAGIQGMRLYASMPFGPDASARARRHVRAWTDTQGAYIHIVRRMYAWRLGEVLPATDLASLRGMEGARMKETYRRLAEQYGVPWKGRRYDRSNPEGADEVNQAINHASAAVYGAAMVSVAVTGAIPQLGFIHEDSGVAFALDVADIYRDRVTLPVAFSATGKRRPNESLEHAVRRLAASAFRREALVARMIDRIKDLLDAHDPSDNE